MPLCWGAANTFVIGFFFLRIPWYKKIIDKIKNEFFKLSRQVIKHLYTEPAGKPTSDSPKMRHKVLLCFNTFWRILDQIEARTISGIFFTKSCGRELDPLPSSVCGMHHPKLPFIFYLTSPLKLLRACFALLITTLKLKRVLCMFAKLEGVNEIKENVCKEYQGNISNNMKENASDWSLIIGE